ncbi:hypothetical protein PP182_17660 [Maribacter sp. PR1]|uniref:Uncharacterized protein n=1 Tax=Maribacter cobaltidurans TaxID=1178778 RepID=A0ABU7IYE0_9FLAO|nr:MULTISPECIES: hypothetical protein [Maribacter]MDC6390520.1 hypothetical protein [Maribacter sp. PR1]MEE1977910.1 hypothetical protein [Maribacter cobaltidurans]
MKIRIKGNSVRLRLTKTEVGVFCKKGLYEEKTHFPDKIFTYSLQKKNGIDHIEANFSDDSIIVNISEDLVIDWDINTVVGFQHYQKLLNDETLFLLIEKDFVCLDETIEDQSDNYPNPLSSKT